MSNLLTPDFATHFSTSNSVARVSLITIAFMLVAGPGIAPGTRAYETLEILFLYPASVYLKNFLTIHFNQKYLIGRGNSSSKSNGSGNSLGALPYARFNVSLVDIPFSFVECILYMINNSLSMIYLVPPAGFEPTISTR